MIYGTNHSAQVGLVYAAGAYLSQAFAAAFVTIFFPSFWQWMNINALIRISFTADLACKNLDMLRFCYSLQLQSFSITDKYWQPCPEFPSDRSPTMTPLTNSPIMNRNLLTDHAIINHLQNHQSNLNWYSVPLESQATVLPWQNVDMRIATPTPDLLERSSADTSNAHSGDW